MQNTIHSILGDNEELPPVHPKLLAYLERMYPLEGYKNVRTLEDLQRYNGAQEVLDRLRQIEELNSRPTE